MGSPPLAARANRRVKPIAALRMVRCSRVPFRCGGNDPPPRVRKDPPMGMQAGQVATSAVTHRAGAADAGEARLARLSARRKAERAGRAEARVSGDLLDHDPSSEQRRIEVRRPSVSAAAIERSAMGPSPVSLTAPGGAAPAMLRRAAARPWRDCCGRPGGTRRRGAPPPRAGSGAPGARCPCRPVTGDEELGASSDGALQGE